MAFQYRLRIRLPNAAPTYIYPDFSKLTIGIKYSDYTPYRDVYGSIKFGGKSKEDEFEYVLSIRYLGNHPVILEQYDEETALDWVIISYFNLIFDAEYNHATKEVELNVEGVDINTILKGVEDTEYECSLLATDEAKFNVDIQIPIFPFFEFSYVQKNNPSYPTGSTPSGDKWAQINFVSGGNTYYGYCREGFYLIQNDTNLKSDGNKSYQLYTLYNPTLSTGAVLYSGTQPSNVGYVKLMETPDGTFWTAESNIVTSPILGYFNAMHLPDFYTSLIRNCYYRQSGNYTAELPVQVTKDMVIDDIQNNLILNKTFVVPSNLLYSDKNNVTKITLKDFREFMYNWFNFTDYGGLGTTGDNGLNRNVVIRDYHHIINTKLVEYNDLSIDFTAYRNVNWSFNRMIETIEYANKPKNILFKTEGETDGYKSENVTFRESVFANQPLDLESDTFQFDFNKIWRTTEDEMTDKLMVVKCEVGIAQSIPLTYALHQSIFDSYSSANNILLRNSIYRVTISNYPSNYQWNTAIYFTIQILDLGVPIQSIQARFIPHGGNEYYFTVRANVGANSNIRLIAGQSQIISYPTVVLERVIITAECPTVPIGGGGVKFVAPINETFKTANILSNFIGNMPYSSATYTGASDILVHKKPDRKANVIKYVDHLALSGSDFNKYFNADIGELIMSSMRRSLGGDFDEFEGLIKEAGERYIITEQGDNLRQEDEDNLFVTE